MRVPQPFNCWFLRYGGVFVLFCNEETVLCAVVWISIPKSLCVISFHFNREMVMPGEKWCLVGRGLIIAGAVLDEPRQSGGPDPSLSLTFLGFHGVSSCNPSHYPVPSPICCLMNQKQRDHLTRDWNHETVSPNKPFSIHIDLSWFFVTLMGDWLPWCALHGL